MIEINLSTITMSDTKTTGEITHPQLPEAVQVCRWEPSTTKVNDYEFCWNHTGEMARRLIASLKTSEAKEVEVYHRMMYHLSNIWSPHYFESGVVFRLDSRYEPDNRRHTRVSGYPLDYVVTEQEGKIGFWSLCTLQSPQVTLDGRRLYTITLTNEKNKAKIDLVFGVDESYYPFGKSTNTLAEFVSRKDYLCTLEKQRAGVNDTQSRKKYDVYRARFEPKKDCGWYYTHDLLVPAGTNEDSVTTGLERVFQ